MITDDPGAGEPSGIHRIAAARTAKAVELRGAHTEVTAAVAAVSASTWRGASQLAFEAAMHAIVPDLLLLASGLEAQAIALHGYATRVDQIKNRQATLEAQRRTARAALAGLQMMLQTLQLSSRYELPPVSSARAEEHHAGLARQRANLTEQIADETARLARIDAEWRLLVGWRRQADSACQTALSGNDILGALAPLTGTVLQSSTPVSLLTMLSGLSASDLWILLQERPELANKLAASDPASIAGWWAAMNGPTPGVPSDAQNALITLIPSVIGNLDGVAYYARDRANTLVLDRALAEAAGNPNTDPVILETLRALKTALGPGMRDTPPRQFVAFSLDPDPKAAITRGDLDTATNVTYLVPGMGTNVAGNIGTYVDAANALRREQMGVTNDPDPSRFAVIAWLDYSAPSARDVVSVSRDDLAQVGAERLADALNGLRAARTMSGRDLDVSVVAHSYGTNVAALALTRARADHLVLLGSAGVSTTIPNARSLNVPSGELFASQGAHDGWAGIGQVLSGRQDPTAPAFGAHGFSSEEGEDENGRPLHGITQHGPFAPRDEPNSYSYLDSDTNSLHNTARATTGLGANLPIAGTPSERAARQLVDRANDLARKGLP